MTAGVPTGPDSSSSSSLQVRCVSPRLSCGFTREPDYVNENDQSVVLEIVQVVLYLKVLPIK